MGYSDISTFHCRIESEYILTQIAQSSGSEDYFVKLRFAISKESPPDGYLVKKV